MYWSDIQGSFEAESLSFHSLFILYSVEYLSDAVLAHLIGYADSVLSMPACDRDCNAELLSWHTPFVCP